ncbi:crotonase/enoyl-CoA hydratase family protein [Pseudonocardia sp. TMWB2A]|uniref:crotonase/enoyl-CoA hydratase family protein n=1 Tax=Pseudonocardia sp. TMWB2A TaxID=687430 RepID=UPI00307F50AC
MTEVRNFRDRVSLTVADHIADVRLIRADKMNALDGDMFAAINEAIDWLAAQKTVRAVVLSGEGRSFCAGLDVQAMMGGGVGSGKPLVERTHGDANFAQAVAWGWRTLPMPVIAAVHGVCFGGGFQIMSGADIRVATADARMAIMEMKWGIVPDMAGYALWKGLVRDDILRELTYTNREFSGAEAAQLGFVSHIAEDPHSVAMGLARTIAAKNPHAIRAAKGLFNANWDRSDSEILMAESVAQDALLRTPNQMEQIMAEMQKRPAHFED